MEDNRLYLKLNQMPLVKVADRLYAEKPFLHADRRADFHVLLYVIQGSISIVEEGTEYEIDAGSLFFMKAGLHHYGVTPSAPDSRWIYVHFLMEQPDQEDSRFQLYTSHIQEQEFDRADYDYAIQLPKLLVLNKGSAIEGKLYHLVEWFHSSNPLRAGYMNPLLQEILLDCYMEDEKDNPYSNAEIIYEIIQFLEEHTHENFASGQLEAAFHLSYKHLCRIFKQATGRTMTQYHTELRVNEASRLLRETTYQITDISSQIGFVDPLYFSNVFKKVNGVSPRNYRQRYMTGDGAGEEEEANLQTDKVENLAQSLTAEEEHFGKKEAVTETDTRRQSQKELDSWLL